MKKHMGGWRAAKRLFLIVLCLAVSGCGSGGDGHDAGSDDTGATLQGNVISFTTASYQATAVSDIMVSIGGLTTSTDDQGNFLIENIPTGDQIVRFETVDADARAVQPAETDSAAEYLMKSIERDESITMPDVEIIGEQILTAHTGTWTGTAGSSEETDPGTQGQIAFTMVIDKNGNTVSGTGTLGPPDNSRWLITGTENGVQIDDGTFQLEESDSQCARGGRFSGTFSGNTFSGTFDEIIEEDDGTEDCGDAKSGTIWLEKE